MNFNNSPIINNQTTPPPAGVAFLDKKIKSFYTFIVLILALACSSPSFGVEPEEILHDPELEERARNISKGLRCVVCQNQSIDDSNAGLARDMRIMVRERIVAGDSDAQVTKYMVSRYGDYILLNPPLNKATFVLWFGPLVIVGLGLLIPVIFFRRGKKSAMNTPKPLNEAERRRIKLMLEEKE